jgi:hypothetical protein
MPQRPTDKKEAGTVKSTERDKDGSKVTLSGLLNAIDGVASQVGDEAVTKLCLFRIIVVNADRTGRKYSACFNVSVAVNSARITTDSLQEPP